MYICIYSLKAIYIAHSYSAEVCGLLLVSCAFTAVVLLHPEMLTYFYIYYGITTTMAPKTTILILIYIRVTTIKLYICYYSVILSYFYYYYYYYYYCYYCYYCYYYYYY